MFIFVRFLPEGHSLFMRNFNLISWAKPDQKNNYVSYGISFFFGFSLTCTTFMSFHAMKVLRLGNKNKYEFILYCARLFVPFHKKRLHSEKQNRKTSSFILLFHSFALPLHPTYKG